MHRFPWTGCLTKVLHTESVEPDKRHTPADTYRLGFGDAVGNSGRDPRYHVSWPKVVHVHAVAHNKAFEVILKDSIIILIENEAWLSGWLANKIRAAEYQQ